MARHLYAVPDPEPARDWDTAMRATCLHCGTTLARIGSVWLDVEQEGAGCWERDVAPSSSPDSEGVATLPHEPDYATLIDPLEH